MRALVSLVVVALVGFAVAAHSAAAGSGPPKKADLSVSVNVGPASATADVSTDGASADASTPSTSVDATASTENGVSATVDTSTPAGEAAGQANVAPADTGVHVQAHTSTPPASGTVDAGTKKGLDVSTRVTSPVVSGGSGDTTGLATPSRTTAADAAPPAPSNEGASGVARRPVHVAAAPIRRAVPGHAGHPARTPPLFPTKAPLTTAMANAVTASAPPAGIAGPRAQDGSGTVTQTPVVASAWNGSDRGSIPASSGGAFGSGFSGAGFLAILSALLMLAAPLVGRWLRPATGLALRPAFASLPERPG